MTPAIVVIAFNRPHALRRLLDGLLASDYCGYENIPLVISIDGGGDESVACIARAAAWQKGPLRVVRHQQRLGVRSHVLKCGDLANEFGSVVVLEDDLMVSPHFYPFAASALEFYEPDPRIAGISLYSFGFQEFSRTRFMPFDDGRGMYFLNSASSSGQGWTARQWSDFRGWYASHSAAESVSEMLPAEMLGWPETSWKKYYNSYLQKTGKYFAVPRRSYTTNMGDAGAHYGRRATWINVPLALGKSPHDFVKLDDSMCRYDPFFEIEPVFLQDRCPELRGLHLSVDLYGTKSMPQLTAEYALTAKPSTSRIAGYGLRHFPPELNVIFREPGDFFSLAPVASLKPLPKGRARRMRHFFDCPW